MSDENKKKILFINTAAYIAGAELSLYKLVNKLLERGYSVEVLFEYGLPKTAQTIDFQCKTRILELRHWANYYRKTDNKSKKLIYLGCYSVSKILRFFISLTYMLKKYDAVVVNKSGVSLKFACRYPRTKVRMQFVRISLTDKLIGRKLRNNYDRFGDKIDHFICVSKKTQKYFDEALPEFSNRSRFIYNVTDNDTIIRKAENQRNPYEGYEDKLIVVTIGRLHDASKAVFRAIKVFKKLVDEGYDFYWFMVGGGQDIDEAKALCKSEGLTDRMIFTGHKENPYPYLKFADVSAILSNYEGYSGVLNESLVLNKATIATDFAGADEQLESGVNGLVVDNDFDSIYNGMKKMITDEIFRESIAEETKHKCFLDDESKVDAFLELIYDA